MTVHSQPSIQELIRHQKGYSERPILAEANSRCARGREAAPSRKNPSFKLRDCSPRTRKETHSSSFGSPSQTFLVIAAESFSSRSSKQSKLSKNGSHLFPQSRLYSPQALHLCATQLRISNHSSSSDKYSPPHLIDPNQSSTPHPLVPIRFLLFCQSLTPSSTTTSLLFWSDP